MIPHAKTGREAYHTLKLFPALRYVLLGLVILVAVGLVLPFIIQSRAKSDRIACENHLRELGLFGVQQASAPGEALPLQPREELPPGTFLNDGLPIDQRMSWYAYVLNVVYAGPQHANPQTKHRQPQGLGELLKSFEPKGAWDSPANAPLANYRLAIAICPAQVKDYPPGKPIPTNYIANGGLGADTPELRPEVAGSRAGAYWFDGPTRFSLFKDGLGQTIQIMETNSGTGPWLRGGHSTLRGLDANNEPYLGAGRQFGGCHPGGCNVSFADGSVRFINESVSPNVFARC